MSKLLPLIISLAIMAAEVTCQRVLRKRPNIVFVLADDLGYNDIGYHNQKIITPNIDKLAADGIKLENYYVQPICTPTRSQLMTGRYQIHTGLMHKVIQHQQPNGLPLTEVTLPEKLRDAGYSTHLVGKWHLGFFRKEYLPWNRGFDTFFGYLSGSETYYTHTSEYNGIDYLDLWEPSGPVKTENGHYSTHMYSEKAIDIINNSTKDKPFFLYLAHQAPHGPMEVPDEYVQKYSHFTDKRRAKYAAMITCMDEGIGNVSQALRDNGLWDNTVFIFSSDNGGTKRGGSNYPYRGGKSQLWEGGVKTVGFVSGGYLEFKGTVNKELLHVSDWFPTLVTLGGGTLNGTKPLDGVDQWATISTGAPSARTILLHNIDPLNPRVGAPLYTDNTTFDTTITAALRVGDFKLLTGNPGLGTVAPPPEATGIDSGQTTVWTRRPGRPGRRTTPQPNQSGGPNRAADTVKNVWLYNLATDPTESQDLSEARPNKVKRILDILQTYYEGSVPVLFPDADPACDPANHGNVWSPWR